MVQGIPFLKLSGLVVKSLAKPMAKQLKEVAGDIGFLRNSCIWIGQTTSYVVARMSHFTAEGFNHHKFRFVELKKSEALKNGAEIVSEALVLATAVSVALLEYARTNQKKALDDQKRRAQQAEAEARQDARLLAIERALRENRQAIDDLAAATEQSRAYGFWRRPR
ncbi:hypothetical protein CTAYLR_001800 [Chrysophaeum taylorii]|uniref:OPA3-like protein n=1 Tax=Chrysophaeum taylorii TaxID=2483200 RepID=A0AAD7U922_9STRA|nr:hypothetical protein CTAYLR_001800 [Chrysophaeum taylorii]